MTEEIQSFVLGTIFLDLLLLVALVLTALRRGRVSGQRPPVVMTRAAMLAIAVQSVHLLEEWRTGFYVSFPRLFGLDPWPPEIFLGFNLAWLLIWLFSLRGLRGGAEVSLFVFWFLGIASLANCVGHPLLSVLAWGYFPGLWTSPLCGAAGAVLTKALADFTRGGQTKLEAA